MIVKTFETIVDNLNKELSSVVDPVTIHYGSSIAMLSKIIALGKGISTKDHVWPIICLFQPFSETMGQDGYVHVKIDKLVIAMNSVVTEEVPNRYEKTFIPVLYPIYYELLNQITLCGLYNVQDPDKISHIKKDNPGAPPPPPKDGITFNYYVDAIEIYNLELLYNKQINC